MKTMMMSMMQMYMLKKCDPVFNSFVAYLNAQKPGKFLGFFCILRFGFRDRKILHVKKQQNITI